MWTSGTLWVKEACVWQHAFPRFADVRTAIGQWIVWYNTERPHQALGYCSPRQQQRLRAAEQTKATSVTVVKDIRGYRGTHSEIVCICP
jgi:hypothetical protein